MIMTIREQRAFIDAYDRGEEIEWKFYGSHLFEHSIQKEITGEDYRFDFINLVYHLKPKRWRAEVGNSYFCISTSFDVIADIENYDCFDNKRYSFGNYFQTKEQAEKARELVIKTLTQFHEDMNELIQDQE